MLTNKGKYGLKCRGLSDSEPPGDQLASATKFFRCVVLSRQGRRLLVARHDNAFVNSAPRPNSSGSP